MFGQTSGHSGSAKLTHKPNRDSAKLTSSEIVPIYIRLLPTRPKEEQISAFGQNFQMCP